VLSTPPENAITALLYLLIKDIRFCSLSSINNININSVNNKTGMVPVNKTIISQESSGFDLN
jgi:hypothetical protein